MPTIRRLLPVLPVALALAAAASSCTDDTGGATTTTEAPPTTIGVTVRTTTDRAVSVGAGVDSGLAEQLEAQLAELQAKVEVLRGLSYLSPPQIVLLGEDDFSARRASFVESKLDPVALAVDTRLYRLLGLLSPAEDLNALLTDVSSSPVEVYYDDMIGEVVIAATVAEPGPVELSEIVAALTMALTDQYHHHASRAADLTAAGRYDEAEALTALASADALTSQLRYLEGLPDTARVEAAAATDGFAQPPAPEFLAGELAFPADTGLAFVTALLNRDGLAGLDGAYSADPLTTELVSHPERYLAGEGATPIEVPAIAVNGYELRDQGSLGELGLQGLLSAAAPPGLLTQTTDGWGSDAFVTLSDASDVAFLYLYRGDSADDAVEVAQAFLNHAAFVMGLAEPLAVGGGVEFVGLAPVEGELEEPTEGNGTAPTVTGPYVFVDRSGAGLVVIVAGDVGAGRAIRDQVDVP